MKKIGLVSDSHGNLENLKKAVDQMGDVDLIIHMGDYISDGEEIRTWTNTPVMAVKGNMDSYERKKPDFIITEVEGIPLYIAHGHRENVKWGPEDFAYKVKSNDCKIGIYGHTHRKDFQKIDDVIIVNPGSCSLPNDDFKSFAILTLDNNNVSCDFYEIE